MNIAFVTCVYNSDYISNQTCTDPANGNMRWQRFYKSLANISKTLVPIVIYTNPGNKNYLHTFCTNNFAHKNFTIIELDLQCLEYFQRTEKLKEYNLEINKKTDRYAQLVLSKIYMVEDTLKNNYYNAEKYFWIDAGLSFQSLFPDRWRDGIVGEYFKYTCFNPTLITKLDNFTKENMFVIVYSSGYGMYLLNEGLYTSLEHVKNASKYYTIGGLWGGSKQQLSCFIEQYKTMLFKVIDVWEKEKTTTNRRLFFEEPIFSAIVCNNPEKFYIERFDTWYQENDSSQVKNILPGMRNFYKIITGEQ